MKEFILSLIFRFLECAIPTLAQRFSIKLTVHRAYWTDRLDPRPYLFLTATNVSPFNRELEISHVWFEFPTHITPWEVYIKNPERPLPVTVKPNKAWQTWIALDAIPEDYRDNPYEYAIARLSTGLRIKSKKAVDVPKYGDVPGGSP